MQFYEKVTKQKKEEYVKKAVRSILSSRSDLSNELIHLTREYNGETAERNLISILKSNKIEARNVDFYLKNLLPERFNDNFKVLSLTETPLDQIKNITSIMFQRKINLEPYGLIFSKNDLLIKGVSPVTYLYHEEQREFYRSLFSECVSKNSFSDSLLVFPFLKTVSSTEDFHWEREWKKVGDLDFQSISFSIIVPSVESIKEVYKSVYLHEKKNISFYVSESEEWGSISYIEDQPYSIPGENVMLRTYAEINIWKEIDNDMGYPESRLTEYITIKDKDVNERAYLIDSLGEEIYNDYFNNE